MAPIVPIILFYSNLAIYPYNELAEKAVDKWNKNGCVILAQTTGVVDITILSEDYRRQPWSGIRYSNNGEKPYVLLINRSSLDDFDDFYKQSGACHELGHALGLQHSEDDDSCMNIYWTSNRPGQGDLEQLRDRCQ